MAERVGASGEPAVTRGVRPIAPIIGTADTAAWVPFVDVGR